MVVDGKKSPLTDAQLTRFFDDEWQLLWQSTKPIQLRTTGGHVQFEPLGSASEASSHGRSNHRKHCGENYRANYQFYGEIFFVGQQLVKTVPLCLDLQIDRIIFRCNNHMHDKNRSKDKHKDYQYYQ